METTKDNDFSINFEKCRQEYLKKIEASPVVNCNICGESYKDIYLINGKCKECQERLDAIKRETERRQECVLAIVPKRYQEASLETFITEDIPEKKQALLKVREYIKTGLAKGSNLILSGGVGTGKTHLAMGIIREIVMINGMAKKPCYTTISDIITSSRHAMSYGGDKKPLEEYFTAQLLVIDEIGRQSGSDNEKNILFEILNKRYNNVLPTILITNESGKDVEKYLGSAIVDRMIETKSTFINMTWASHRIKKTD